MTLEKGWEEKNIPLFIHGDGVEYTAHNDNLLVFSWGCLLGNLPTLQNHWLLATFPKSCTSSSTWDPIWKYLKWSLTALAAGTHPTTDPDGKPLEKGSTFFKFKGKPLHPNHYKATLWSIIGGHEFFSNTLKLPHWSSHFPCWECDTENFPGAAFGKGYKEICLEKQEFQVYSHEECLADPWSDHPLFQLPWVSSKNVRGDPLHILFCKGLYSHVIGGILHYICYYEGPKKKQAKKPADRLGVLFTQVQLQYAEQKCKNRLSNLKLSMLTDPQKHWSKYATLDAKGGETRHLLPALIPVMKTAFAETMDSAEENMIAVAESLEKLVKLWDDAGAFLTAQEYAKSLGLASTFLAKYHWLHLWSLEKDRKSFNIVAKHHTFIHLVWGANS